MKSVFLDASVLVAACASIHGASALILGYCRDNKITAVISPEVLKETARNVKLKLDTEAEKRFTTYLEKANLLLVPSHSIESIALCEKVIVLKDAHVLAAAMAVKSQYLITLDQKHFLTEKVKKFAFPTQIITPGNFVRKILKKSR